MQDSWYGFVSQAAGGLAFADWAPYTTASPNTRTFGMNRAVAQTLQGNPLDANC